MSSSKGYKRKKHSTIRNCEEETTDCNELKMVQLFKSDDKNPSRSLVFRISKVFQPQMPSSSKSVPFKKDKIFPSPSVSTQAFQENDMKTTNSSSQICLSAAINKKEINDHETYRNSNDGDNQTHSLPFDISKMSPMQIPSGSFIKSSNENETFSSHQEVDSIENLEKVDEEVKMPLIPAIKSEISSPCKPRGSLTPGKNQSNSCLFQNSETSEVPTLSNSTVIPSCEDKISSYPVTDSVESSEKNDVGTVSSSLQMPLFPPIKKENQPRRSLRLLELQSKLNSSHEPEKTNLLAANKSATSRTSVSKVKRKDGKKNSEPEKTNLLTANKSATSRKSVSKVKRNDGKKDSAENNGTSKMRSTKRKPSMYSTSSSSKLTKRMLSETPVCSNSLDPSTLKLKSMVVFPPLTAIQEDSIYPKFSNVDPSQVLSNLTPGRKITRSLKSGNVVSLFFPDKFIPPPVRYEQNRSPPNRMPLPQYRFKKVDIGKLELLKKYPMIDLITLDKCYDMSNFSIRGTEIMLLDIIAGKEVFSESNPVYNCYCRNNCSRMPYFYFHPYHFSPPFCGKPLYVMPDYELPIPFYYPVYEKQLPKEACDKDTLFREVIIQSLKILNDEEAVL